MLDYLTTYTTVPLRRGSSPRDPRLHAKSGFWDDLTACQIGGYLGCAS